jgi:hypothetical protein
MDAGNIITIAAGIIVTIVGAMLGHLVRRQEKEIDELKTRFANEIAEFKLANNVGHQVLHQKQDELDRRVREAEIELARFSEHVRASDDAPTRREFEGLVRAIDELKQELKKFLPGYRPTPTPSTQMEAVRPPRDPRRER